MKIQSGYQILSRKTYSITNITDTCRNLNTAKETNWGSAYNAEIHVPFGYQLLANNVTITMGGVDITSSALSGNNISIPKVIGDISIIATATSAGLAAGLYKNGVMTKTWAEIVATYPNAFATAGEINGQNTGTGISYLTALDGDLVIDNSITVLGYHAFTDCNLLTGLYIPTSVTTMAYHSISRCDLLDEIVLNATTYGNSSYGAVYDVYTVYYNSPSATGRVVGENYLCEIIIGGNVTSIQANAFIHTKPEKIKLSSSVNAFGEKAFGTSNIDYVEVEVDENSPFKLVSNCLVHKVNNYIIVAFPGYEIPTNNEITRIENFAFEEVYSPETLIIPNNITYIGQNAFNNNKQSKTISFGTGVSEIKAGAFGCTGIWQTPAYETLYFYMDNVTLSSGAFKKYFNNSAVTIHCKSTNTGVINYAWSTNNITATIIQDL